MKSKMKKTVYELKSFTFDPTILEPISRSMESKSPNEGSLHPHLADGLNVTKELIKKIIEALRKV